MTNQPCQIRPHGEGYLGVYCPHCDLIIAVAPTTESAQQAAKFHQERSIQGRVKP